MPGEFRREGPACEDLPQHVRLHHLVREPGQLFFCPGGQFPPPDGAADDRQGGPVADAEPRPQRRGQFRIGPRSVHQTGHHGQELSRQVPGQDLKHCGQVAPQTPGIGLGHQPPGHVPVHGGPHQLRFARPPPVDRRFAGMRPRRDGIHRHPLVAHLAKQDDDGRQDRALPHFTPSHELYDTVPYT